MSPLYDLLCTYLKYYNIMSNEENQHILYVCNLHTCFDKIYVCLYPTYKYKPTSQYGYMTTCISYLEKNTKTTATKKLSLLVGRFFPLILGWFCHFYVAFCHFADSFSRSTVYTTFYFHCLPFSAQTMHCDNGFNFVHRMVWGNQSTRLIWEESLLAPQTAFWPRKTNKISILKPTIFLIYSSFCFNI